jgi:AcrR family transcriptional regulator
VPKPSGPNKETRERTRTQLLEAGAQEFVESTSIDPFQNLSLKAVAERAGLTRNGLIHHWTTKEAFTDGLAKYLLEQFEVYQSAQSRTEETLRMTVDLPPSEALMLIADLDLSWIDDPKWPAMEILTIYAAFRDSLKKVAVDGYRAMDKETWEDFYKPIADRAGRQPRAPLTGPQIGTLLQALAEGTGIRRLADQDAFLVNGESKDRLFTYGAAALLVALTCQQDDSRTVDEFITDAFD